MEWIAAHPFHYDDAKSMEENIHDAEALAQEYLDTFGTTDRINTPERQEFRRKIADDLYGKGAAKKEGKVWLVLGVPASGKSTIADPLVEREGALLIDSDEAKTRLPEFSNGLLAGAVHEESAKIAEDVFARAMANHDNMVLPLVGKTMAKLQEKIDKLREGGYEVGLIYVDLPIEKAIERTKTRFRETGRLVSPNYLRQVGLKPKHNYDKLKVMKGVDSYEAWDSDVARGSSPRNIELSPRPEQEAPPTRMGGRGQHARQLDESRRLRDSGKESRRSALSDNDENRSDEQGGFSMPENAVQKKSAPLGKQEQEALTGISEEAKEAYCIVRDKLAKSKNKAVARAAKVGATLFARHADIYAKAYSKATGKAYTALDYLQDKFGLDADGKEMNGGTAGFEQRAWVGSAADFDKFDLGYVGTGEGAQVHGYGLYTAQGRSVAEEYRENLIKNKNAFLEYDGSSIEEYSKEMQTALDLIREDTMPKYARKPIKSLEEALVDVIRAEEYDIKSIQNEIAVFDSAISLLEENINLPRNEAIELIKKRIRFNSPVIAAVPFAGVSTAEDVIENIKQGRIKRQENLSWRKDVVAALKKIDTTRIKMGKLYEVEIPDNDVLLDEQKTYEEQPQKVRKALDRLIADMQGKFDPPEMEPLSYLLSNDYVDAEEFPKSYKEMIGQKIYNALAGIVGSPKEASKLLNEHGIKGITYDGRQDGRCFVVFDDTAIEIIEKYNQRMNDMRKGSITPQASGRRVITLFEQADESTFLHELGHMFLMDLEDISAVDERSAEDLETVKDWATWQKGQAKEYKGTPWQQEFTEREKAILAAEKQGDAIESRKLKREWEQERFARGFERYLETGKAPTSVLKRIFQKFKKFLKSIYQAFKGMGGKATPEVEAVMGRMITDEEMAESGKDSSAADDKNEKTPVQAKSVPMQADFSASKLKGAVGKETSIATDSGEEIPVRYRLVEAQSLITSNSAKDFKKNPLYPKSLQPRDRERANMQQQIREMTSSLRPQDLAESRSVNLGAPVVRADGVVLNGNGRAIAITRALLGSTFKDSTGKGYRDFLKAHAEDFGLKPESVARMHAPILVREVPSGLEAQHVEAVISSTAGGSRLGASEQAKQDAEKITLEDLARYEENERGDLTTAANRDFVAGVLYHIAGKNDVNAYTDAKGQVNADGIQRVKRALFQKAYGDDNLLSRMAESTDDNTRNITNGLTSAAPYIARVNTKAARAARRTPIKLAKPSPML